MPGEHFRKLTEDQVRQVMALCEAGYGDTLAARKLGIPYGTVRDIYRGRSWKHITGGRLVHGKRPPAELAIYNRTTGGR